MKPKAITLDQLDATIRDALKNHAGVTLTAGTHSLINGIVLNEKTPRSDKIARDITKKIEGLTGSKLTVGKIPLGNGKIIVGFKIPTGEPL
jgi:hypothetical protein